MTDTDGGDKATPKGPLPPYIAFKSLIDIIDRMEREGPPTRVDGTWLESYAGGYRPTVISNLHVMGLLTKDGVPTQTMLDLVQADEAERKDLLALTLGEVYSDILAMPMNSTQGEFLAAFSARGANGDTRRKAISFFLKACNYAGVETGSHWKTPPASASGTTRKRVQKAIPAPDDLVGGAAVQQAPPPAGGVITVKLKTGGTLTLTVNVDPVTLKGEDRTFFYEVVDKLDEYIATSSPADDAEDESDSEGSEE